MCPAKTQISLGVRPVWSESLLSAWRKLGSLATHWAHSEDSDQTGRMPRLIWVFAGCTCQYVGFIMRWLTSVIRVQFYLSLHMTKPTKWLVHPTKTPISLGICPVWSVVSVWMKKPWVFQALHWAHSEDSDQTTRLCRLIWVFAGGTSFVGFVVLWLIW